MRLTAQEKTTEAFGRKNGAFRNSAVVNMTGNEFSGAGVKECTDKADKESSGIKR